MKLSGRVFLSAMAIALVAVSFVATAQDWHGKHHHYVLTDLGTFGGPGSYFNGGDILAPYLGPTQVVNDAGTVTGWADTSALDPYRFSGNSYAPFCFNADCYVSHAFEWRSGSKTDLGVLPGGLNSATSWVSANSLIAGTSQNGDADPLDPGFPEDRAVLWRDEKIIDLGTLPGGNYESGAESVNSRGQVVGWAFNTVPDAYSMGVWSPIYNQFMPYPYPYQTRAFLWQDGAMQDLGTLGSGTDAFAMQINEQRQVIGISYTSATPNPVITGCSGGGAAGGAMLPTQDPFLWENNEMTDLGTLGGTCGFPSWINNRGEVVGLSDLAGDAEVHPFLWTKDTGMRDLGTLGGTFGVTQMISNSGKAVGGSTLAGDTQEDAFLWDGTMHNLGALNGCSYPWWINDGDQVVGNWGTNGCRQGGFLWENGGPMVDLNTLVSSNAGLSVAAAVEINNRGEIVGDAVDANGNLHAILLIPCDDNHPGIAGCDYGPAEPAAPADVRLPGAAQMSLAIRSNRGSSMGWMSLWRRGAMLRRGLTGIDPATH
jgi:probable HAF family extracellular repeat protein